jgi:glucose-1-phosphate thymidylyltransferase
MRDAGVGRVVVVIREGKWDIPAYLGDGGELGVALTFVVVRTTNSVLETLRAAVPWLGGDVVVLGFPDIVYEPEDHLDAALDALIAHAADAVLAAVPTDRPDKADVLELGPDHRVRDIAIKPRAAPNPSWTWIGAAWSPVITRMLLEEPARYATTREPYPGDLLREAIARGLDVRAVVDRDGRHLDLGTPEDLARAWAGSIP